MKKLFIFLILISSIENFAQENLSVDSITDTEQIIDKYGEKIIEGFNSVVENVTPYAEQGFEMVVKLQIAKGIIDILPLFLVIIFFILFKNEYTRIETLLNSDKVPKHMSERCGVFDGDNITALLIIYLIISVLFFIFSVVLVSDGILRLLAPEWYAIKEILTLI